MPPLEIRLLGAFHLQMAGEPPLSLRQPRLQSLLAYLILHRDTPQPRRRLAYLFWPDSSEAQALTNLRGDLHQLRQAWTRVEEYLEIQRSSLHWRPQAPVTVDVIDFEQLAVRAEQAAQGPHLEQAVAALTGAVEAYAGPLLPECYDDWVMAKREALAERFAQSLDSLIQLLELQADYPRAIQAAQRLVHHDPLRESTYLHLMRLYTLERDRASALRTYHACAAMLEREIGVAPGAELRAAYTRLMDEEVDQLSTSQPAARSGDPAKLVGRQSEWQQLRLAWQRARRGQAAVVAIAGEAGIGKTRLAEALADWVRRQSERVAVAQCYAEGNLAFQPLVEWLRGDALAPTLPALGDQWLAQVARLLPEVAEHRPQPTPIQPADDALQRRLLYENLARAALADGRPLLLVVDDLHWCDRETLAWLGYFLRFASRARLLLVVTVRSEELVDDLPLQALMLSLRRHAHFAEIRLERLDEGETAALAAQVLGRALTTVEAADLHRQTEGNPLFVGEMMRAQVDRTQLRQADDPGEGGRSFPSDLLPAGMKAVIEARLARLSPPAQEVAHIAAVIGRSFAGEIVAQAGGYAEDALVHGLDELWQRHIIREQGAAGYDFSHGKIRDVAYSRIPPSRRRLLHRRVAESLEVVHAQALDPVSRQIAAQYELAHALDQAVAYYQRAAHYAQQTSAGLDALELIQKAAALLQTLPESEERLPQTLEIQLALSFALSRIRGLSAEETQQAYRRALALAERVGADGQLFEILWNMANGHMMRADRARALELGRACWELAQQVDDPELLLQAHHALWHNSLFFYESPTALQTAIEHAQQGLALYRPEWHLAHVVRFGGHDPGVCALGSRARMQWLLGYPEQALASARRGLEMARQLGHPFTQVMAYLTAAHVHWARREPAEVLMRADEALKHWTQGIVSSDELAWRGWALGQLSPGPEAIALLQQALTLWRNKGKRLEQPALFVQMAETHERLGDWDAARGAVAEGLAVAAETGEDDFLPELYRLQGRYLKVAGETAAAEQAYRTALDLARAYGTRSLELRAAMDLSASLAEQGQAAAAYDLLAKVYGWFTEGFDTQDLKAAQALLKALAAARQDGPGEVWSREPAA